MNNETLKHDHRCATRRRSARTAFAAACLGLLAACAGREATTQSILDAEAGVNRAENNAEVREHAPVLLADAKDQLGAARSMWANGDDQAAVDNAAYLAQRKAESAEARGRRGAAQAKSESLEDRRSDILISAREREANTAMREAEAAKTAAERERARAERARNAAQAARAEAEAARAEAEKAKDALASAEEELAELKPRITERGLVLTLPDVLFAVDSAELKPSSLSTLDRLAEYLVQYPQYQLAVEGHTDSTGTDAYNQGLSERRARSAQSALVERGVAAARIRVAGFGESRPVADNTTAEGRALNRRVEVILLQ